jgi:hypothetical protein
MRKKIGTSIWMIAALLIAAHALFASGGQAGNGSGERMEISYYSLHCGDIVDDNYCEALIQDKMGIEVKTRKVS